VDIVLALVFFLLGISVGSFLNVVADRVPLGKSILSPPSHCFQCGRKLERRDLIPVISYILLKGRCRYCGAKIPARSMVVELFTGLLFIYAFVAFGVGWMLWESLIYASMFIILLITDLERGILPHRIVYPCIGTALLLSVANSFAGYQPDIRSSLTGLGLGFVFLLIIWGIPRLFKRSVMGFGDVGMAGLIGASVGFPMVTVALYLAIIVGGLSVLMMILLKLKKTSEPITFGIFLAVGALGTIFWGKELWDIAEFLLRA
jgi:leader peptidase (prepilin peptidase) / N-methyltransferase